MIITKTKFLNYTRCNKYLEYEKIHDEKVSSKLSLEDYKNEIKNEKIKEILGSMFDDKDTDLTREENAHLNSMMEYYKKIEVLANDHFIKKFGGVSIFSLDTFDQKMFSFDTLCNKFVSYADVYNENADEINIIEVKATTSNKYLGITYKNNDSRSNLFVNDKGVYCIDYPDGSNTDFDKKYEKLKNRYDDCGKYIYDLAVQRYFFEKSKPLKKVNYYLAVLNHEYVYDGCMSNGENVYNKDANGNEIISFFKLNEVTKDLMDVIDCEIKNLEKRIKSGDVSNVFFGKHCQLKKSTECIYKDICYKDVPSSNASYNFLNFVSFKDESGNVYDKYGLLNKGILKMEDVPFSWLNSPNHKLQYICLERNKEYVNKEKINAILNSIEYPIYHLDFEGFPCPLPRFKGEKCYSQSVFEFSLHIERKPGVCDEIKDNFVFLVDTFGDERKLLAKALVDNIDTSKGTMLAQNVGYEKARIKELSMLFPEYKEKLLKINNMAFDLMYILKNNKYFFENNGFSEKDVNTVNYYHNSLSGSYSIKKTLPVLVPHLSYENLNVKNGTEAVVEYSKYNFVSDDELKMIKNNLVKYCRQDTWAMVEILDNLRKKVK